MNETGTPLQGALKQGVLRLLTNADIQKYIADRIKGVDKFDTLGC